MLFVPSSANQDSSNIESSQYLATGLWLVGKFAISSSFVGIWLFGAEIFPTTVRTTGLGICNIASRTGGILAPFSSSMVSSQQRRICEGLMIDHSSVRAHALCLDNERKYIAESSASAFRTRFIRRLFAGGRNRDAYSTRNRRRQAGRRYC